MAHSRSMAAELAGPQIVSSSSAIRNPIQMSEKPALRPCSRDLAEFFKSTGWASIGTNGSLSITSGTDPGCGSRSGRKYQCRNHDHLCFGDSLRKRLAAL